jgi:hypothetical protein
MYPPRWMLSPSGHHEQLWMALLDLPHHSHQTSDATRECKVCRGRDHIKRAYQLLPAGSGKLKPTEIYW